MPARTLSRKQSTHDGDRPIKAVMRVRVSSPDQEKDGFSIPAQCSLLREYAASHGIIIVEEFVDAESSRIGDGDGFTRMVLYLKRHPAVRVILVEKTDRLYRNPKDWVTIDELDVEIRFVKEGQIVSSSSRSSEKFVHGLKVLMAKNFCDNLSEETLKGLTAKAQAGIYPSFAPVGYKNADGPSGKRIIIVDPDPAPVIAALFERFVNGTLSIKRLVALLNAEGLKLRGRKLQSSTVHQILRKRIYCGDFDWNGTTYEGTHEPIVNREVWQRVQGVLDERAEKKTRKVKHDFAFTGLIHCGHCGCLMVGELKKGRYVYYHCTGNRGKCPEPHYTRQEKLIGEFANLLQDLVIPRPVLEWLGGAFFESDRTEQAARQYVIKRWQVKHDLIEKRIETMYMDKLDGRITQDLFDKHAADCRREQKTIRSKIRDIERSASAPIDAAIDMMGLISRASGLFLEQPGPEQRRLLQVVLEKAAWKDGSLRTTLSNPLRFFGTRTRKVPEKKKKIQDRGKMCKFGSSGRIRTYNPSVNSRMLYH